jgi:hypothetical protein
MYDGLAWTRVADGVAALEEVGHEQNSSLSRLRRERRWSRLPQFRWRERNHS